MDREWRSSAGNKEWTYSIFLAIHSYFLLHTCFPSQPCAYHTLDKNYGMLANEMLSMGCRWLQYRAKYSGQNYKWTSHLPTSQLYVRCTLPKFPAKLFCLSAHNTTVQQQDRNRKNEQDGHWGVWCDEFNIPSPPSLYPHCLINLFHRIDSFCSIRIHLARIQTTEMMEILFTMRANRFWRHRVYTTISTLVTQSSPPSPGSLLLLAYLWFSLANACENSSAADPYIPP